MQKVRKTPLMVPRLICGAGDTKMLRNAPLMVQENQCLAKKFTYQARWKFDFEAGDLKFLKYSLLH